MRIRRLGPRHLSTLLGASSLFDHPPSRAAARRFLENPHNVFWLAEEGVVPVGFLRGTALDQLRTVRRQMFLYEVGVGKPYRRRGVGRSLIEAFLEHCRSRGYEEAFVLTDPANRAAVRLYRATGARPETPADRMYVYRLRGAARRPVGSADARRARTSDP